MTNNAKQQRARSRWRAVIVAGLLTAVTVAVPIHAWTQAAVSSAHVVPAFAPSDVVWADGRVDLGLRLGTPHRLLTFQRGRPMLITLSLKNVSSRAITLQPPPYTYFVDLADAKHQPCCHQNSIGYNYSTPGGPAPVTLSPGEAFVVQINLSVYYTITDQTAPGTYFVTVRWDGKTSPDGGYETIVASPIEIRPQ